MINPTIRRWLAQALLALMFLKLTGLFDISSAGGVDPGQIAVAAAEGDVFNQIFYSIFFVMSAALALDRPKPIVWTFARMFPLVCFLCLVMLSILWSGYPDLALRRGTRFVLTTAGLITVLVSCGSLQRVIATILATSTIALCLDLIALPAGWAYDLDGNFSGFHGHKNTMGAVAAICIWFSAVALLLFRRSRLTRLSYLVGAGWIIMLLLSGSKTSFNLSVIAALVCLLYRVFHLYFAKGVAVWSLSLIAGGIIAALTIEFGFGANLGLRNLDLTGRVELWQFLLESSNDSRWLGVGFGSFWGVGDSSTALLAKDRFIADLLQAHNGFLEVFIHLGVVGIIVLASMLLSLSSLIDRSRASLPELYPLAGAGLFFIILTNITESYFGREAGLVWTTFLVIYVCSTYYATPLVSTKTDIRSTKPALSNRVGR